MEKPTRLALVRQEAPEQPAPEEKKPQIAATLAADGTLTIRVQIAASAPPDELVAFPFGFEQAAATKLVRSGRLQTAQIGRRVYAARSAIVALVKNAPPRAPKGRRVVDVSDGTKPAVADAPTKAAGDYASIAARRGA